MQPKALLWPPYLIFILSCRSLCQFCKKVILRLSVHDDAIIAEQKNIVFGYLSIILALFRTLFGYFRLKKSGNPAKEPLCLYL